MTMLHIEKLRKGRGTGDEYNVVEIDLLDSRQLAFDPLGHGLSHPGPERLKVLPHLLGERGHQRRVHPRAVAEHP